VSAGEHLDPAQWPILLSLEENESDRRLAVAHAEGCPPCDADRRAAALLLLELSRLPPLSAPTPEALRRAASGVWRALAIERSSRQRVTWAAGLAGALAFGLLVATLHPQAGGPWGAALILLGAAVLTPFLVSAFRGWGLALAGLSVPFALSRATSTETDLTGGLTCLTAEALAAALPVAMLVFMARRRGLGFGGVTFAGVAAGGALAGQAALLLSCPNRELGHLLIFHAGVVLLAASMGAAVPKLSPSLMRSSP
jgi:hypothetical protein